MIDQPSRTGGARALSNRRDDRFRNEKSDSVKRKKLLDVGKAGAERTARVPTRCVVVG